MVDERGRRLTGLVEVVLALAELLPLVAVAVEVPGHHA